MVTRRLPAAPAAPVRRGASAPASAHSSGYRGSAGLAKMQEEQDRSEARRAQRQTMARQPFRFRMQAQETKEFIVVDDADFFFRHEHNLQDEKGVWSIYTSCIDETANCPVCAMPNAKPHYFAMYLTIIDLTPYVNRDGVEVPWSKKLLVIKPGQQKKFTRLYERHGTLRGMHISATRDGEKDAAIGSDFEFIDFVPEEELEQYVAQHVTTDNKVIDIVGHEPFNYEELFPEQTERELAQIAGGRVQGYDEADRQLGRGRAAQQEDDWEGGGAPRPASRAPARPAARPAPRTAAPAARPAARPAPRTTGRVQQEEVPEAEEAYEEEEAAPPPRRAIPPTTRAAAPATRAAPRPAPRAAPRRDEPEEEAMDDDPPQRPAPRQAARPAPGPADAAARRAQIRGGR